MLELVFSLAAVLPGAGPQPAAGGPHAGWYTDLEAGRAEAQRTGKPLLVVFL